MVALLGLVVAAVGLTHGPNLAHIAAGLGLPLSYVQQAQKWARRYGVPLDWVLSTILVESGGKPNVRGDSDGRSVGLMQVNVVAHAHEGVTLAMMLDPAKNIEWGTKYLRQFRDQVEAALGGRTPPIPLDQIVRLAYKGPTTVVAALQRGQNPANISWAPEALARWRNAMARVRPLMGVQSQLVAV
jgi:hypothetical protein